MKLIVQSGPLSGDIFDVTQETLVIGRGVSNDIVLPDPAVSRVHAQIRKEGKGYVVEDAKSANGTFVNDDRLAMPHILRAGDEVRMGETVFRVEDPGTEPVMGADATGAATAGAATNRGMWIGIAALVLVGLVVAFYLMNQSAPAPVVVAPTLPPPPITATVRPVPTAEAPATVVQPTAAFAATSPSSGRTYPVPVTTLIAPAPQTKITSQTEPVTFSWNATDLLGANEVFRVQVSTTPDFAKIACDIRTRETSATIPSENAVCTAEWEFGKQYYWRVHVIPREFTSDSAGTALGPASDFTWGP